MTMEKLPGKNAAADEKHQRLKRQLARVDSLLIAFSGGVDSSYLAAVAQEVLQERVTAVTAVSPIHPLQEKLDAIKIAKEIGVNHVLRVTDELASQAFVANRKDRCYICKKNLFRLLETLASEHRFAAIAHGANVDDLADFRPGHQAAREMDVSAPLVDAGLTKADIRYLSRGMGLSTWNQPAQACLATRIPYGTEITAPALAMIEKAERVVYDLGFNLCRVRHHGSIARVEIDPLEFDRLITAPIREQLTAALKEIGFTYIALDLDGYVTGSMNRD
jgi:uncharacterized protein